MAQGGKRPGAGRKKGSKNKKTQQWEALHESIIGQHAEAFNEGLSDLMQSLDEKKKIEGLKMYISVLEYFKPKYSRIEHAGEDGQEPFKIVINKDL